MKALYALRFILPLLLLGACTFEGTGPQGPVGPQGPEGPAGRDGEEAYVFEYSQVNFTSPDYRVFLEFPESFQMLESDMVLVYMLWGVEDFGNGPTDIWRQLPQSQINEFGWMQYNFDFTRYDVSVFIEADFNKDILGAAFTDDWVVRTVVIPGQFGGRSNVDYSDYHAVVEAFGLKKLPIPAGVVDRM